MHRLFWWRLSLEEKIKVTLKVTKSQIWVVPIYFLGLFSGYFELAIGIMLLCQVFLIGMCGDIFLNHNKDLTSTNRIFATRLIRIAVLAAILDLILLYTY